MAIYLDNEPLTGEGLAPGATVGSMIEMARGRLSGSGRMVLGLRCGECEVSAEQLDEIWSRPCDMFDRLEVIAGRPGPLVADALAITRQALSQTYASAASAAEHLTAGNTAEAMRVLGECCAVWARVHESVVRGCALLSLDVSGVEVDDRPVSQWLRELAKTLVGIKGAIESRDTVLLGDILRYEMEQTLADWERMLDGLIDQAQAR
jgi:hypothetical protein